jgi:hypothetical protein
MLIIVKIAFPGTEILKLDQIEAVTKLQKSDTPNIPA